MKEIFAGGDSRTLHLIRTPSICSPICDGVTRTGTFYGHTSGQVPVESEPQRETVVGNMCGWAKVCRGEWGLGMGVRGSTVPRNPGICQGLNRGLHCRRACKTAQLPSARCLSWGQACCYCKGRGRENKTTPRHDRNLSPVWEWGWGCPALL